MAILVLLASSLLVLSSACSLALRFKQDYHPARFLVAILTGWLILCYSTLLLCGLIQGLQPRVILIASSGVALILGWIARHDWRRVLFVPTDSSLPRNAEVAACDQEAPSPLLCFGMALVFLLSLHWLRESLTTPTQLAISDDFWYHMLYPALWVKQGAIFWPPTEQLFSMQVFFPFGGELIATWFVLPFRAAPRAEGLAWVSLLGWIYIAVILTSAADLLRRVTRSPWAWLVTAGLCLTSLRLFHLSESFADIDLALPAVTLAALSLALPRADREEACAVWQDGVYVSALLGLMMALKLSAFLTVPVIAGAWLLRLLMNSAAPNQQRRLVTALLACGMLAAGCLLLAGYWYLRNGLVTGNPLFPVDWLSFSGVIFEQSTLKEFLAAYGIRHTLQQIHGTYLDWGLFHGWLAVSGLLLLAGMLIARRRQLTRTAWFTGGSLLLLPAVLLVSLPGQPFSAGNQITFELGVVHHESARYVSLVPLLGWIAWAWMLDWGERSTWKNETGLVLLLLALSTGEMLPGPFHSPVACIVGLWVGALLLRASSNLRLAHRLRSSWQVAPCRWLLIMGCLLVPCGMTFMYLRHAAKSASAEAFIAKNQEIGSLVKTLEEQQPGQTVAILGERLTYLLLGRNWQFTPVMVNRQGQLVTDWHEVIPLSVSEKLPIHAPEVWQQGIKESGVNLLVLFRLSNSNPLPWPRERAWLRDLPTAKLKFADENVELWQINPPKNPAEKVGP